MQKTPPNARERELMIELMILRNGLRKHVDACEKRLKTQGTAWRDARLLVSLVDKLQNAMIATLPDRYVDQYIELARKGTLKVVLPGPLHGVTYSLVSNTDLAVIAEYALRDQCGLCIRTGKEARDCPLRKALLPSAPPEAIRENSPVGCEYADYAARLRDGEEVIL